MAIHWPWAWGNDTPQILEDNAGFAFDSVAQAAQSTVDPYTYAGSPTRYSMTLDGNFNRSMLLPAAASPGPVGACSVAARNALGAWAHAVNSLIQVESIDPARLTSVYARYSGQALALYVDNTLKETTANFDWVEWHYVTLKWDMTTTSWTGQIFVDGVAATALQTDTSAVISTVQLRVEGGTSSGLDTFIGQIITYDNTTDPSEAPRFCTKIQGNADGTNIGTWAQTPVGSDFANLSSPIDPSTYVEEATPTALDRVELLTSAGASDIATALGTSPSAIDAVATHQLASGQSITARALVGDGTAETAGPTVAIGASTVYSVGVANGRPSGGLWLGTDQPRPVFEVVA